MALVAIGVFLLLIPIAPGGQSIAKVISESAPFLSGETGTITYPNGTTSQVTLIPADQVSFKMSLIATYEDGSTQTIFEKSTLPALAVVRVAGKPIRNVQALAVVAVASSQPLPASARALFALNFSAYIEKLDREKWIYREVESPLISNGRVAVTVLPPFQVLGDDVFPVKPVVKCVEPQLGSTEGGGCTTITVAQNEQRRVNWALRARVIIDAPGYQRLDLLGSTLAFADFNYDGSIIGGCTDCGTIDTGTGGGGPVTIAGPIDLTVTTGTTTGTTPVASATITSPVVKPTKEPEEGGTIRDGDGVTISSTVDSSGRLLETTRYGDREGTQRVTHETYSKEGGFVDAGGRATGTRLGAQYAWIIVDLPPLSYVRLEWTESAYLVNPFVLILVGLAVAGLVGYSFGKKP
mgnify:CR=1 FL=1